MVYITVCDLYHNYFPHTSKWIKRANAIEQGRNLDAFFLVQAASSVWLSQSFRGSGKAASWLRCSWRGGLSSWDTCRPFLRAESTCYPYWPLQCLAMWESLELHDKQRLLDQDRSPKWSYSLHLPSHRPVIWSVVEPGINGSSQPTFILSHHRVARIYLISEYEW